METDFSLLNAARRMDKDAIVKIFDLYATPLYNYALRLCGDSLKADHIVGDVFAKLIDQFASGKGPTANLRSYLYETAYHIIIDDGRTSRRWVPLEALMTQRADVRSAMLFSEEKILFDMILQAIQQDLTIDQRHVIVLRFLEGFSLYETAAILHKKVSHVKVIQGRAIAKLRQVFQSREFRAAVLMPRVRELSKALRI
jgi:RNA polymerase sigma-70 factor (ECF subfamily)